MRPAGFVLVLTAAAIGVARADIPNPGDPPPWLDYWSFSDTNTWGSDAGHAPVSFTNLAGSLLGDGTALDLNSTNAAWLRYKVNENGGATNLTVDRGSVMLWFVPSWAGTNLDGTGPGDWGRLIEVGSYTTNAAYGWWSLYLDPAGVNLYFAAQTNDGSGALYLSVPIAWTTNDWHMIVLTYCATNTALYLDGELATNGPGVSYWPGPTVLTNGFFIGSASNGLAQARGLFDDLSTYNFPLDADTISSTYFFFSIFYDLNPYNSANFVSATPEPVFTPEFNAIAGAGFLTPLGTNSTDCVTSTNVWFTNVVATLATNGTMSLIFTIAGGSNGVLYDVFANSVLDFSTHTSLAWAWMGQGYHCTTNLLTDLAVNTALLILGKPQDSDHDGLTDAYELLVSKTDPNKADTDGDGFLDGWEVMWGMNPRDLNESAQTSKRLNYQYDAAGWLRAVSGLWGESLTLDAEGNVQQLP